MSKAKAHGRYILDAQGNPQPEPSLIKWAMWYEDDAHRILVQDQIGEVRVSTIFLGLDFDLMGLGLAPVLWETMVFGGEHDTYCQRYTSREAALAGHKKAVELVNQCVERAHGPGSV